jgi:hypothetical protein
MGESMSVEGATDALAFEAYVEHFLGPSLGEGQVVVLDGLEGVMNSIRNGLGMRET